jgi:hypothetical protein
MADIQTASLIKRVEILEAQLAELRNMIVASKPAEKRETSEREKQIVANIKNFGVQDAVIFSMLIHGVETKEQMKKTLDVWGMPYLSWFDGGNFNNRLLKKGIVRVDGKDENGEEIYSLTMNGERVAEEKLAGLKKE